MNMMLDMTMTASKVLQSFMPGILSQLKDTRYYFDSGASICIIRDMHGMTNVRNCPLIELQGVTGTHIITQMGDLTMLCKTRQGNHHCLTIPDVMYYPLSPVNLISFPHLIKSTGAHININAPMDSVLSAGCVVVNGDEGEIQIELAMCDWILAFITPEPETA